MKSRHWADMGESTFVAGIWILFWIHRLLGRWPFRLFLFPVVAVHWLTRPLVRKASLEYLGRVQEATNALGRTPGWRDSLRHMATFAETMLDKLLAFSGRYPFDRIRYEGRDALFIPERVGRGGVIVTAHMGCLELCQAMADRQGQAKLNILVHTRHAERFNRILQRLGPDKGLRLMEVTEMGPATAMALSERVSAGEFVVIAGDRIPVNSTQIASADFLGHPAPFPVGPYVLAALLKCPLYLLVCIHDGPGYTIHFECISDRVQLPRGKRELVLAEHARDYAERVTALVKRAPYDWFNFFPFWDQAHASVKPHA